MSKDKRPAEESAERLDIGRKHLRTAVRAYRKQYDEGRLFLHEHPESATSWDEAEMIALQELPGVFTVCGPICCWEMQAADSTHAGVVYKKTKWVTNSRRLARLLGRWCENQSGMGYHVHVNLINGISEVSAQASCGGYEGAQRAFGRDRGGLIAVELRTAGPNPSQDNWPEWSDDAWEDVATFFDNVSREQLPTDNVLEAQAEELGWCRDITLYTKVHRSMATARGIKPVLFPPAGWMSTKATVRATRSEAVWSDKN